MQARNLVVSTFVLALVACDNEPAEGKSSAVVSAPLAAPAAPSKAGAPHAFSSADSKLEWIGAKVTGKHDGGFKAFKGSIDLVEKDPLKSSIAVEIDTTSVFVDNADLEKHLKKPDFLDVEKFPRARFVSTSVATGGDKGATHTVTGNLELHGVTKSIKFPANIRVTDAGVDVDAEFAINRKDFGIMYPGAPDDLVKDDVLLKLQIRAKPAV